MIDKTDTYPEINKLKQEQVLKIVSSSFYKELVKYGIDNSDIVSVSMNLLDYATEHQHDLKIDKSHYDFRINAIQNDWENSRSLKLNKIALKPLNELNINSILLWLKANGIKNTFIDFFPKDYNQLKKYLLETSGKSYFAVYFEENFVGIIGAERIDNQFKKLEMKKFIGASEFRGQGIGKTSTFLFLYYTFCILNFNKVFIHSMDTNIKNINLNSNFGFNLEGLLYNEVVADGKFHDVIRMGLLKEKWLTIFDK